jgi:small-conductance mechanosensitive channel
MNPTDSYQYYLTSTGQRYIKVDHGDGTTTSVPNNSENSDYIKIMKMVEAGDITIADAE